jgi:hypothetical protein
MIINVDVDKNQGSFYRLSVNDNALNWPYSISSHFWPNLCKNMHVFRYISELVAIFYKKCYKLYVFRKNA